MTEAEREYFLDWVRPLTYIPPVVEGHVLDRLGLERLRVRAWGLSESTVLEAAWNPDQVARLRAEWLSSMAAHPKPRTNVAIGDVLFRRVPPIQRIDWRRSADPYVVLAASVLGYVTPYRGWRHLRKWCEPSPASPALIPEGFPD